MQTLLVISKSQKTSYDYITSLCKANKVNKIDVHLSNFEKAAGIEDVRNFQKRLFLKPISSNIKIVILELYKGITIEAQNALLKVFEEPPQNTLIAVTINSKELLLPTILSRCKIVELKEEANDDSEEIDKFNNILISLLKGSVGDRLKVAQDISKDKNEALLWIEKMILAVRKELVKRFLGNNKEEKSLFFYRFGILTSLVKTYSLLKNTNANPRLALENLFLSI